MTWAWTDEPGGSGIDPAACTATSTSSGQGAALQVSVDLPGPRRQHRHRRLLGQGRPDGVPASPARRCPCTSLRGPHHSINVTATVTDALSGPAAATVAADVAATDLATIGARSKTLTGSDVAGNQADHRALPYLVQYQFLGFREPTPRKGFKRGSVVPATFRLGDGSGAPISDADALALVTSRRIDVTLDGTVVGWPVYDWRSDTFLSVVVSPKLLVVGTHTVGIRVREAGGGVVNTESVPIVIKK